MSTLSLDNVRLGAFLVLGLALVVSVVLFFSMRDRQGDELLVVTYFDEPVTGLEFDSPVRYRGVPVGRVHDISIAPDRKHIEVVMALDLDELRRLGFDPRYAYDKAKCCEFLATTGLRAVLKGNVLTGRLFVLLDIHADEPPSFEPVGFEPEYPHLPSTTSSLKEIEDHLTAVLAHLPQTLDRLDTLLEKFSGQLAAADLPGLVKDVRAALDNLELGKLSRGLRTALADAELPELSKSARGALDAVAKRVDASGARLEELLAPDGKLTRLIVQFEGALADARAALAEVEVPETATSVKESFVQLEAAMTQLRLLVDDWRGLGPNFKDTLRQLRLLGEDIEAEPESILFGPRRTRGEQE